MTIAQKLLEADLGKGQDHERIEKLGQEVEKAITLLETFNATSRLTQDYEIVGKLVGKLYPVIQWEWSKHSAKAKVDREKRWDIFREWLGDLRDAAHQSKIISMAQKMNSGPTSSNKAKTNVAQTSQAVHCYCCG